MYKSIDVIKESEHNFALSLRSLSHYYGQLKALTNINLDLLLSETLFITGESGAGKSTLLKIISRQLAPSEGRILWHKHKVPRIAWVSQHIELVEKFSFYDNLWVAYQKSYHDSYEEFMSEVLELAKYFKVFDKLDLPMSKANGGLRQMMAIIRAIISRPELLVFDEPTKSLDEKNAIRVYELLSYYCKKNAISVVWASHNRSLIKKFSGRMIHLEGGAIVYSGQSCFI